jgi:hypothetical protein
MGMRVVRVVNRIVFCANYLPRTEKVDFRCYFNRTKAFCVNSSDGGNRLIPTRRPANFHDFIYWEPGRRLFPLCSAPGTKPEPSQNQPFQCFVLFCCPYFPGGLSVFPRREPGESKVVSAYRATLNKWRTSGATHLNARVIFPSFVRVPSFFVCSSFVFPVSIVLFQNCSRIVPALFETCSKLVPNLFLNVSGNVSGNVLGTCPETC